jgi:hypothetical protein
MDEKLIDYTRVVALMAQQDVLEEKTAVQFCKAVLPQLLAELEVMSRVAQSAHSFLASISPAPKPEPVAVAPPQPAKKARPKRRKSKGVRK